MLKRLIVIVVPMSAVLVVTALIMQRQYPAPAVLAVPAAGNVAQQKTTDNAVTQSGHPLAENTSEVRILELAKGQTSPAEMAALLRQLYSENPDGLFDTLMRLGKESLEIRRIVLPLLADALLLWPEADGRYIFPVADSYADMDLPAAAEWGAAFLVKTGRTDMAASSLLGRLAKVSEGRALSLIASLPEAARRDAMNSVACHMEIGDLNHLMQVCGSMDAQGISIFSKQLFERLGMERLNQTAAWLQATAGAARIPGAVTSISQALVINDGPQKAMAWADSLPEVDAEAQAITSIYREWAKESPASAIKDILSAYDGAPQLMADVFKGAAEHHGTGAAAQWEAARHLVNSSARAYAISSLIEPMLVTIGPTETKAKIAALPTDSLEREAADLMIQAVYMTPSTVRLLESRFGKTE